MLKLATELIDPHEVGARSTDVVDNQTTVTRSLSLIPVEPHWSYGDGKGPEESVWRHARTFLRVESVTRRAGIVVENDVRFFVSNERGLGFGRRGRVEVVNVCEWLGCYAGMSNSSRRRRR